MTTFKLDPIIIIDDPITIGDDPLPLRTPDIETLSIDVVLIESSGELQLRLSGTNDVVPDPYVFDTGYSPSCSVRFTFRGGLGSITIEATSQCYQDSDGDGIIELTLASPGEYTLGFALQPTATAGQQGIIYPKVPTTKVVLRPESKCPQPTVEA